MSEKRKQYRTKVRSLGVNIIHKSTKMTSINNDISAKNKDLFCELFSLDFMVLLYTYN